MRKRLFFVMAALFVAGTAMAASEVTHAFTSSAARGHAHRVIIAIPAGDVKIRNGTADRISVRGDVHRRYDGYRHRAKEQNIADAIDVEVVIKGDDAIVRRRFGPAAQSWNARSFHSTVDVVLTLPAGIDVDIVTRYGDVNIDGAFGAINSDLRAGEIHVRTPRANVRDLRASVLIGEVHTYLGDHYIENEGIFPHAAHFHNAGGRSDVNVHSTVGEVHVTLTQ
jgi:hypothetical protein